ncbi:MAG: 16S rRNA (cytosine(1402)-N(4))-methyltransferase [Gemmatimonadales bacterium]|jgi:16S rRNA (cytosine1402-N4)-methyltransferase
MPDEAGAWDSTYHAPVLVSEIVAALAGASRILDGTLGGGGHTAALLDAGATVDALDRDPEAVRASRVRLSGAEAAGRFRAFTANFAALDTVSELRGIHYDGMLLDLGVSSHQVDDLTRGFSFRPGALLDMRMARQQASQEAPSQTITPATAGAAGAGPAPDAAGLLNTAPELDLIAIFRTYADEPRAGRLAREIVRRRASRPFATSDDLVGAIRGAFGARTGPPEFARLFQAVRIAVNDEIAALTAALPLLRDRLAPGGRLAVIAYHSGEDRVVKHTFRDWSQACHCPPRQAYCTCGGVAMGEVITRRAVVAAPGEVARNPRARSAKLRVWRRAA